jgi:hypothetical protein
MNAEDIVKVLRHCYSEDIKGCNDCPLNRHDLCYGANLELLAADLIEKLQVEVNEWQERHRQAAINWQQENKECVKLQEQLAESQRRERAAVEDLREGRCCRTCNVPGCSDVMISVTVHGCDKWQWRGPQEGELNAETDNPD